MDNTLGIITEIIVLIFNILIYMQVTVPKKNDLMTKLIMYIGSALILSVFFVCTYFLRFPEALASFVFVTLPSFILFFALSKFKDFRFFVTFCFLEICRHKIRSHLWLSHFINRGSLYAGFIY